MAKAPNFLVIGDVKAGTTSLHRYCAAHPDVLMPSERKELRYFAFDASNPYHVRAGSYPVRSFEEYLSYFSAWDGHGAIGEASPNYLRSPIASKRIRSQLGAVKLVVSLRNPADRLLSQYTMAWRAGAKLKTFDETVFRREAAWIKSGFYWSDLIRYYERFPRENIKVIVFDDLKARPEAVMRELFDFLDVDPSFTPSYTLHNQGGMPRNRLLHMGLHATGRGLKRLVPNAPARWRGAWQRLIRRSLREYAMDPETRAKILEVCQDDIRRTGDLVGRDLSRLWQ